ncbi:MAG TPA: penicillin-binding protein 1A [Alphaproteobacteria bacterium]|nr:penicillin-binding protein 1A [Alphaproteobacteria bacterium]HNS44136.1 penicillin-binding protein 1A [Alphaproteobacteria bacterium]
MAGVILVAAIFYKYGQSLPEFAQLKDYKPPVVTRVHAGDGRFLAEFAQEKRIFVPVDEIPDRVKRAFISAEDQDFYKHKGVDLKAIARAVVTNLKNLGVSRRPVGASTITQQVAKNFLLSNELSYARKIKEAILAYKMERVLSKDRILELYLNQIFLGARAYGVAAASLHYFNKPLNELTIAEAAYLAALPKAPNNYHPTRKHAAAVARRNWVIDRMAEEGYITGAEAELAKEAPLVVAPVKEDDVVDAPYFAEEVRRELIGRYGADALYGGGLSVRTSLDPRLQDIAERALQNGLVSYDRRHGWRGPLKKTGMTENWQQVLKDEPGPVGMLGGWRLAMVLDTTSGTTEIGFSDGTKAVLTQDSLNWTKSRSLKAGDIILAEKSDSEVKSDRPQYEVRQVPLIQGAVVALDPNTGRILAIQGGWKFDGSEFNRATQANRQPGSAFKPFVYLAALDKGYTPSTIILDAPVVFTDAAGNVWRPENYHGDFYGPTPLRVGIEKSRNLMTIRLAQQIGIGSVVDYAKKFGISENMKPYLSGVLGADETTLMKLTTAYGMIVNGGKKITPTFIDRVQDRMGKTVEKSDMRPCIGCGPLIRWESQATPDLPDTREQIADPRTTYQMVSIMEGVVQRGTGRALAVLDRPLAGKTGTTNDSKDAWFIGFTPDLVVGVFTGFDDPKTLGKKETGASVALPVFKQFMEEAMKDIPPTPFRVPEGVRMVQVNAKSGQPTYAGDADAIWEPFLAGTEPSTVPPSYRSYDDPDSRNDVIDEPLPPSELLEPHPDTSSPMQGTGGIY